MDSGDVVLKTNSGKGYYLSALIEKGKEMIPQWKITISYLTAEHAGQTDKQGRKNSFFS